MAEKTTWVDKLFGRSLTEAYHEDLEKSRAFIQAQGFEIERQQESIRELSLYLEDLQWTPLFGWEEDEGFSLKAIKEQADHNRALLSVNPTIKKAVNARVGYIWGRGVTFSVDNKAALRRLVDNPRNQERIFAEDAHWRLEAMLATDGNVWVMRNKKTSEVIVVPLKQIHGWVTDVNDPTTVNYWLRKYTIKDRNLSTGETVRKDVEEYIPVQGYTGTARSIDQIKVNRDFEMIHVGANKQESWVLGLSDLSAAMFWAKNHKELFEAGSTFVKAQGKYAAKVISKSEAGGQQSAATLRDAPRRDPETGEILNAGGTAVVTGGLDYQLMGKMTGGVDFESFDPVAGLIAAGLGVPLDVLLAKSDNGDISLEQSTVNEMILRQKSWTRFFKGLFGGVKAEVVWPKIRTEPEYRRLQAVGLASEAHVLHRAELRQLSLEGFGLDGDPNDLPPMEEHPAVLKAMYQEQNKIDSAAVLPAQGVTGEVGKLSTGSDAKDARDNKLDTNVANQ